MRRLVGDSLVVSINKTSDYEERSVKAGLGRKTVRYAFYEVTVNGDSYVLCKSPAQVEELASLLRLEIFHVPLPVLSAPRSPRSGGGGGGQSTADEYLTALCALAPQIGENKTFRTFLSTNVAPPGRNLRFWDQDVRKKGWLDKKKGERAKLQRRFCCLKFGTLYYFKSEDDINPAGSIRLDLVEVSFFRDPEGRVGFSLQGGRKHNPRTFITENQPECDRWVAEIRAIKAAHEKAISVQGVLTLNISEGRNLNAQNVFVQAFAESQQHSSNVAVKCTGNPTWTSIATSFQITSNRKFVHCMVWDQPSAALASPTCLGEVSIPVSDIASSNKGHFEMWVPICPQKFLQSAAGEIHLSIDYAFIPDEKTLEEQHRMVELNHATVEKVMDWFRAHPAALKQEGLFRIPGRLLAVQAMWDAIAAAKSSDFSMEAVVGDNSVEDIGGLLKMCLRNISIPLFPFECFEKVCGLNPEDKNFLASVREVVQHELSESARRVLRKLLVFLKDVAAHEEENKMSSANLSVVFGPALLREQEDSLDLLFYLPKINSVVKKMIENANSI